MANATDNRKWIGDGCTFTSPPKQWPHKVGANVEIFAGTLVGVLLSDSEHPIVPLTTDGTTEFRGISTQHINNLGGAKGDAMASVVCETAMLENAAGGDACVLAGLLRAVYAVDNQTVANNDGNGLRPCVGVLVGFDGATGKPIVWADAWIAKFAGSILRVGTSRQARVVATSNLGLSGLAAIDGVTPVAGDRILCVAQTSALQNGIYVAQSGAWSLAPDWAQGQVFADETIDVSEGTVWAHSTWKITTQGALVIGTTALVLYPRVVKGAQALTAGAATVSSLYVLTGAQASVLDTTAAAAVRGVLTAGQGTGSIALTGTGTDTLAYVIVNW